MKKLSILALFLSSASPAAPLPKLVFPIVGQHVDDIVQKFDDPIKFSVCGKEPGISLIAPVGTPIYAALAGKVVWIGDIFGQGEGKGTGPYGIIVDHGNHLYTVYGHNNNVAPGLRRGDWIMAGQHIADVGQRGYASRPVLYFRMLDGVPLSKEVRAGRFTMQPFGKRMASECPHYVNPTPLFLSREQSASIIGNLKEYE